LVGVCVGAANRFVRPVEFDPIEGGNKMKKDHFPFYVLLLSSTMIISCASVKPHSYLLKEQLQPALPALRIQLDHESITSKYDDRDIVDDATTILNNVLSKNLFTSSQGDESYGYANCRILRVNESRNRLWLVGAIGTLTVSTFLGVPYDSDSYEVELALEILDTRKDTIGTYIAHGKGKAYGAFYWGYYGIWNLRRAANAKAIQDALDNIRTSLQKDATKISTRLLKVKRDYLTEQKESFLRVKLSQKIDVTPQLELDKEGFIFKVV